MSKAMPKDAPSLQPRPEVPNSPNRERCYVMVGINHQTADVGLRERLALNTDKARALIAELQGGVVDEVVVLSTCNRVEVYAAVADPESSCAALLAALIRPLGQAGPGIQGRFYTLSDTAVVAHLFAVASGLDSMVTGENQITGQVKAAYELAQAAGATGFYLSKLFHRALAVAKRVRSETGIGRGTVSVGSAAVMLARKIFGTLAGRTVLLVGTGKIGKLCVRYLNGQEAGRVIIVNRTREKALVLEQEGLGIARPWEELAALMREADVLITSVEGGLSEISPARLAVVMQERAQAPLFIIDLGVPRNVAVEVGNLANVYLYNIDDLKSLIAQHRDARAGEITQAKNVIDEEVRLFYEGTLAMRAVPEIALLGQKFERLRKAELEKALSRLTRLSQAECQAIDQLTRALVGKILHDPILSLKGRDGLSEPRALEIFKKIFKLDDEG